MGLFGGGTFLDPEDEAWQVETWGWFLKEYGGRERLKRAPLVAPTREFFPPTEAQGEARAAHIFDCVKTLAGMRKWECKLLAQPHRAELKVGELQTLKPIDMAPAGTFSHDGNAATITYQPADVAEPMKLIAIFIHELAHYLLAARRSDFPGGEEVHEYTTDLLTVYLGFGLFQANSAFNFSQHQSVMSHGWQYARQGYLGERAVVFALAAFLELREQGNEDLRALLKPHLFADLAKARKHIVRRKLLAPLMDAA
ncbi:MAG TPA: hypothetical protein VG889_10525 [Rhizomicrobium sp.]|nr:hypothetical protein [Rhizomicrobium sp.]